MKKVKAKEEKMDKENKVKYNIFKDKIFYIALSIILVIGIISIVLFAINKKEEKVYQEDDYTLYIMANGNYLVEIDFTKNYYNCVDGSDIKVCEDEDIKTKVKDITALDDDLSELNSKSINDEDIISMLSDILNVILENGEWTEFILLSDYYISDETLDDLKSKIEEDITLYFDYQEKLDDDLEVIEYHTVTFDTSKGSSIDSVVVRDNAVLDKPKNPTKDGYTFKGWYIDNKEYDFSTKVTEDITLTAKWEKNSSSINSSSSNSSSNTTKNKLNLNDNISATVYTVSTGMPECFLYIFSDNLKDVYPNVEYNTYSWGTQVYYWPGDGNDRSETELSLSDLSNPNIKYNTTRENNLKNTLDKYNNTAGFKLISFNNDNHKISLEYKYIAFNGLDVTDGTKANKEIENILKNAYLLSGPCGGFDNMENVTLTKSLCDEFNLDCGSW